MGTSDSTNRFELRIGCDACPHLRNDLVRAKLTGDQLIALVQASGLPYRVVHHEPSNESAAKPTSVEMVSVRCDSYGGCPFDESFAAKAEALERAVRDEGDLMRINGTE